MVEIFSSAFAKLSVWYLQHL